jgi:hypothetical protein
VDCNYNNNIGGNNMSTIYQNLNVISITVGCSGWSSKRGFLNLHLSDGKIVRFNEWDKEELDRLRDVINGNVKVGIKRKRKYYYLETIVKESEGERRGRKTLEYVKKFNKELDKNDK